MSPTDNTQAGRRPLASVAGQRSQPWRVFLSHTSEFRDYPDKANSYVAKAERAVSAAGHSIVDMADFAAEDQPPAQVCEQKVQGCDVYIGVIGFRYGSPVRDRPEVSYTELEFETATALGNPRLLFLLDGQYPLPTNATKDTKYGQRQEDFRQRLRDAGLTVQMFTSPDHLGQLVERSLRQLADNMGINGGSGTAASAVRTVPPLLPYLPDRHTQEFEMDQALRGLMDAEKPRPLVVIVHGNDEQRVDLLRQRFFDRTVGIKAGSEQPVYTIHLPWPDRRADFWDWIGHHVSKHSPMSTHLPALAAESPGPIVLWSTLSTEDLVTEGQQLVERVCSFWQQCDELEGHSVIHWLSIRYMPPPAYIRRSLLWHWLWDRWSHGRRCRRHQRFNEKIRGWLRTMRSEPGGQAGVVVLSELESLALSDVESWVDSQPVQTFLGNQSTLPLVEQVRLFYSRWREESGEPRIPMGKLAGFLERQLLDRAASL